VSAEEIKAVVGPTDGRLMQHLHANTSTVLLPSDEIRQETARAYPRVLAERGQSYAAGWLAARNHIAEQLEGLS
jgi:hypothetical protein